MGAFVAPEMPPSIDLEDWKESGLFFVNYSIARKYGPLLSYTFGFGRELDTL